MKQRIRSELIRRFIIDNIDKHEKDIPKIAADKFGISRQAIFRHMRELTKRGVIYSQGGTRDRKYKLCILEEWNGTYEIASGLEEDIVWRNNILPFMKILAENIKDIWQYGFTEMFNNAIDHSGCSVIFVRIKKTAASTEIAIHDNGIGIFKKIQEELGLLDERHAIFELAKGKLTTDPKHHSGEGIFFTSRMFDDFEILSGGTFFHHMYGQREDWISEQGRFSSGTTVWMALSNHTSRTKKEVFDKFTTDDEYGFTKTVVPVRLAQYGDDKLVSRSQAKRLLERVDRFKIVIFDFEDVESIGQSFADEIFRVFPNSNPGVDLFEINANQSVLQMINRARVSGKGTP